MIDDDGKIAERHLTALWVSVREASALVRGGHLAIDAAAPLLSALATDARRLADELEADQRGRRAPPRPAVPGKRMKVLLVDDDPCALVPLQRLLAHDFDVLTTSDPTAVVGLLDAHHPDAVVTDLYMPDLDGLALLALVRASGTSAPPVLVASAATDDARKLEALEQGAFDFIAKPIDVPDLKARIHRAVRHARELDRQRVLQQTDDLTGLLNRRAFHEVVQAALDDRRTDRKVALAMIDEDGLKRVNDTFGHAVGDRAIVAIARALDVARRRTDSAARLGGDEFALVMPGADLAAAQRVMARVNEALAANPLALDDGRPVRLEISWGLAFGEGSTATGPSLLAAADAALYEMKRTKKAA